LIEFIWSGAWTVTRKEEQIRIAIHATPVDENVDGEIGEWEDGEPG
jgi:hypothetical protein